MTERPTVEASPPNSRCPRKPQEMTTSWFLAGGVIVRLQRAPAGRGDAQGGEVLAETRRPWRRRGWPVPVRAGAHPVPTKTPSKIWPFSLRSRKSGAEKPA